MTHINIKDGIGAVEEGEDESRDLVDVRTLCRRNCQHVIYKKGEKKEAENRELLEYTRKQYVVASTDAVTSRDEANRWRLQQRAPRISQFEWPRGSPSRMGERRSRGRRGGTPKPKYPPADLTPPPSRGPPSPGRGTPMSCTLHKHSNTHTNCLV